MLLKQQHQEQQQWKDKEIKIMVNVVTMRGNRDRRLLSWGVWRHDDVLLVHQFIMDSMIFIVSTMIFLSIQTIDKIRCVHDDNDDDDTEATTAAIAINIVNSVDDDVDDHNATTATSFSTRIYGEINWNLSSHGVKWTWLSGR
mmetsp:Transcript_8852/g.8643  ORF Transcript_8852/g.8643 Transcript_8852/m.8643 type:complete len:143 (-) Transcript_8852:129-557(-)